MLKKWNLYVKDMLYVMVCWNKSIAHNYWAQYDLNLLIVFGL